MFKKLIVMMCISAFPSSLLKASQAKEKVDKEAYLVRAIEAENPKEVFRVLRAGAKLTAAAIGDFRFADQVYKQNIEIAENSSYQTDVEISSRKKRYGELRKIGSLLNEYVTMHPDKPEKVSEEEWEDFKERMGYVTPCKKPNVLFGGAKTYEEYLKNEEEGSSAEIDAIIDSMGETKPKTPAEIAAEEKAAAERDEREKEIIAVNNRILEELRQQREGSASGK